MLMGVLPSATFASAAYSSNLCCTSSAAASATAWDSDSTAYRRTSFSSAATADIRLFAPDHISSYTAFITTSRSRASHLRAAAAVVASAPRAEGGALDLRTLARARYYLRPPASPDPASHGTGFAPP